MSDTKQETAQTRFAQTHFEPGSTTIVVVTGRTEFSQCTVKDGATLIVVTDIGEAERLALAAAGGVPVNAIEPVAQVKTLNRVQKMLGRGK